MSQPGYNYSNNIRIDRVKCTFCGECVDRCIMDHIRLELSPCRKACPIGQNCQGYIQQLLRGQEQRALSTIMETNPLPGVLGRICHHPCEGACARSQIDGEPVAIRALKRYLSETVSGPVPEQVPLKHPERIAVIGSGPAGLMAAWELRRRGFPVTIYDRSSKPGGNLTRVIPDFRLPPPVVQEDMERLRAQGIEFRLGLNVGSDITLESIQSEHAAVLLAVGGGRSLRLGIDGEDAENVHPALSFLESVKKGQRPALGNSVVVIGGGNAAIDAAQTARRLGISAVQIVCLERQDEMPAYHYCVDEALEEGIVIEHGWGPFQFSVLDRRAAALKCRLCLCVWQDQCFAPEYDCEIERSFAADTFIVAIGDVPETGLFESLDFDCSDHRGPVVDPLTLETSISGIFAAGDAVTGPGSVVEAMASGRQAAISIRRYVKGEDLRYGRLYPGPYLTDFPIPTGDANYLPRQIQHRVSPSQLTGMQESRLGFDQTQAAAESNRCLNCGVPVGCHDACWYCLPCEVACPEQALKVQVPYIIR